ncbi:MAG: hypothetical protein HJJLKODD_02370 [Phycisphaerae bacterium]|nr:hypothetical protein [Phycisphaerae bacterium]
MDGIIRRVLTVGHCGPDHQALSRLIESRFPARVEFAVSLAEARQLLAEFPYQLVLINRVFDATAEEGLELIRQIRNHSDPQLQQIPLMMISNFESAQEEAVAAGGVRGFGKADLDEPETLALLKNYLP